MSSMIIIPKLKKTTAGDNNYQPDNRRQKIQCNISHQINIYTHNIYIYIYKHIQINTYMIPIQRKIAKHYIHKLVREWF